MRYAIIFIVLLIVFFIYTFCFSGVHVMSIDLGTCRDKRIKSIFGLKLEESYSTNLLSDYLVKNRLTESEHLIPIAESRYGIFSLGGKTNISFGAEYDYQNLISRMSSWLMLKMKYGEGSDNDKLSEIKEFVIKFMSTIKKRNKKELEEFSLELDEKLKPILEEYKKNL